MVALPRAFSKILLKSVLANNIFLQENQIIKYLQNYKCYDINQDHFRKPLKFLQTPQKY